MPKDVSVKGHYKHKYLDRLTKRQRDFVLELLADESFNAKQAAKKAGYANPSQAAGKLLKNNDIQRAIGRAQRNREERTSLKADNVVEYLEAALFFNPTHYFIPSDEGQAWIMKDPSQLPEKYGRLIDGMEIKTVHTREGEEITYYKVKLISKARVLELAMKHLGMLEQRVVHSGSVQINWDDLRISMNNGDWQDSPVDENSRVPDAIEQRIIDVECNAVGEG